MDNSVVRCADEIIDICHELKALLSVNGAFDAYKLKLLGRLQRLSLSIGLDDEREDEKLGDIMAAQFAKKNKANIPNDLTEQEKQQGFYFREVNGNAIKFSAETGDMIDGQPKAMGGNSAATLVENAANEYAHRREKIRKSTLGKTSTNFEIEGTEMNVVVPVKIKDGLHRKKGRLVFELQPGKVSHLRTIAASDMRRTVDDAEKIAKQYGGEPEDWVKMKGIGIVKDEKGKKRLANIHFFYNPNIGQADIKVKQWVDNMKDEEKWWL